MKRCDVFYLGAVYKLVESGDIPLDEYKKLLGNYSEKIEQEAGKIGREQYEAHLVKTREEMLKKCVYWGISFCLVLVIVASLIAKM